MSTNSVSEIACDGYYDCFGGHDEALCPQNKYDEKMEEEDVCGKQPSFNEDKAKTKVVSHLI